LTQRGKFLHTRGRPLLRDMALSMRHTKLMDVTNYKDGNPICPACGKAIGPPENTARVQDCMTHLACFRAAKERARPPGLGPANIFVGGFPERTPLLNGAWMRSWISSSDSASEAPRYQSVAAIAGV